MVSNSLEGEKGLTPTNQPVVLELFCSWACRLFPPTRENNTGENNISAKSAILLFFVILVFIIVLVFMVVVLVVVLVWL